MDQDLLVRGTDPRIRIRIRTKMSRIPNISTVYMWINHTLTFSRTKGVAIDGERSTLFFLKMSNLIVKKLEPVPNSFHVKNSVKRRLRVLNR